MDMIGREIKRLREERGWTQAQLAVYAESSQPTVNQVESGKRNPSTRTLQKLAEALGVEVADLFPKAEPRLPFEGSAGVGEQGGARPSYDPYEALGRVLVTQWRGTLDEWNRRLPPGENETGNAGEVYEVFSWALTISRVEAAYQVVANKSGHPKHPRLEATMTAIERVSFEAREKAKRMLDRAEEHVVFQEILEGSDLDAIVSEVERQ